MSQPPDEEALKGSEEAKPLNFQKKLEQRYSNLKAVIQADQAPEQKAAALLSTFSAGKKQSGMMPIKLPKKVPEAEIVAEWAKKEEARLIELSQPHIQKINEYMKSEVSDPRIWQCPEAQAGDWDNVPEMAVQIIDYLTKHGRVVSDYLHKISQLETVVNLRTFTEQTLQETNKELGIQTNISNSRYQELQKTDADQLQQFITFRNGSLNLRQEFMHDQPTQNLVDLVDCQSGITESELFGDNDNQEDAIEPKNQHEPRMITLEQLTHFFNVKLAKSKTRKELTTNNADTKDLLKRVAELEAWKPNIESQVAQDEEATQKRFKINERLHEELNTFSFKTQKKFLKHKKAFEGYQKDTDDILQRLHQQNLDLNTKLGKLEKQQLLQLNLLTTKIDENQRITTEKFISQDENTTLQFFRSEKSFENLKNESMIMIDKQADSINVLIKTDLKNVRETYDVAVAGLNEIHHQLEGLFKGKVFKMKTKVAEIFAQSEIKIEALHAEIREIGKMLNVWNTTQRNPAVTLDAKVYTLSVRQDETEMESKRQQAKIKEVIDKLLLVLQSKNELNKNSTFQHVRSEIMKDTSKPPIKFTDGNGPSQTSYDHLPTLGSSKTIFNQTAESLGLTSDEGYDGTDIKYNNQVKFVKHLEMLRTKLYDEKYISDTNLTTYDTKTNNFLKLPSTLMLKSDSNFVIADKNSDSNLLKKQLQMISPRQNIQLNTQSNLNLIPMIGYDQPTPSQKFLSNQKVDNQLSTKYVVSQPYSGLKDKIEASVSSLNAFDNFIKKQKNQFTDKLKRRSQSIRPDMRDDNQSEQLIKK